MIALDLPGFGASPMPPPGTPPGVDSLIALVQEFLDETGVERPHVAGNSLGGLIVLEMARRGRSARPPRSPLPVSPTAARRLAPVSLWARVRAARRSAPRRRLLARDRAAVGAGPRS